jgi:hypothetical protein
MEDLERVLNEIQREHITVSVKTCHYDWSMYSSCYYY